MAANLGLALSTTRDAFAEDGSDFQVRYLKVPDDPDRQGPKANRVSRQQAQESIPHTIPRTITAIIRLAY